MPMRINAVSRRVDLKHIITRALVPRICTPNQFQCHDNKRCAESSEVCDGAVNCLDASDEKYCEDDFPNFELYDMAKNSTLLTKTP